MLLSAEAVAFLMSEATGPGKTPPSASNSRALLQPYLRTASSLFFPLEPPSGHGNAVPYGELDMIRQQGGIKPRIDYLSKEGQRTVAWIIVSIVPTPSFTGVHRHR